MDINVVCLTAAGWAAEHVFPGEGDGLPWGDDLLDVVDLAARLCEEDAEPLVIAPVGLVGGGTPAARVPIANREGVGYNVVVPDTPLNVILNTPVPIILKN